MDEDARELKKGYLKNLQVWEDVDELRSKAEKLSKSLNNLLSDQKEVFDELERLPKLNQTQTLNVTEVEFNEDPKNDTVRIYVKNHIGEYVLKDDEPRHSRIVTKGREDSIQNLSAKIAEGQEVFAMIKPHKPWVRCHVEVVYQKWNQPGSNGYSAVFHLRTAKSKKTIHVNKYSVALAQDHNNCLEPPKRVIAGYSEDNMYPGTIAFEPCDSNKNRYLVIMDDGSAKYFDNRQIFPIVGQSKYPWMDARLYLKTGSEYDEFYLMKYLLEFPQRFIVKVTRSDCGRLIQLYCQGKLRNSHIVGDDCDILRLKYEDHTEETIYKGSLRIRKQEHKNIISTDGPNLMLNEDIKTYRGFHFQIPVNIKAYYESGCAATYEDIYKVSEDFGDIIVSESANPKGHACESPKKVRVKLDDIEDIDIVELGDDDNDSDSESSNSRNANHNGAKCTHECLLMREGRNESSVKDLRSEFRNVSDLKVPLLLGWKHEIKEVKSKNDITRQVVVYESPCGRLFKQLYHIKGYLFKTNSILDIDYFTDEPDVDIHSKRPDLDAYWVDHNIARDYETGKPLENKNVIAINQCNEERLPFDFRYAEKAFLHKRLVNNGMTLNEEFKSGCDCKEDCYKNISCACHKLTLQVYGEANVQKELPQYKYKRLSHVIYTGIYECNSLCKCSSRCPNRVVQNGIRYRFQVTKTPDKGWGLVCLDDIPRGAFICSYSAEILDDADRYGSDDMYFADMDYIDINERNKLRDTDSHDSDEGVESDENESSTSSHDSEYLADENPSPPSAKDESASISSLEATTVNCIDLTLDDTNDEPPQLSALSTTSIKRQPDQKPEYRMKKRLTKLAKKSHSSRDDERTDSSDAAGHAPRRRKKLPRYRGIHDMLGTHSFTLDARVSGNIGRFCNHSCEPNAYIQNVLIETHDPRLHVPALFSNRNIKAMEEITWDYAYVIDSIPGRQILCNCGSRRCKGRIL